MSRRLDDLSLRFRPLAVELLARLTEAKVPVLIVCTGRTAEEQADAVRRGVSKVARSRHQDGDAIDVAPYQQYLMHGEDKVLWDATDPIWMQIGHIAEALGLRWGGRFRPLNGAGIGWDPGHVEWRDPA